jgi:hypothetical protein
MRTHWCIFSNAVKRSAKAFALAAIALLVAAAGDAEPPLADLPRFQVREPVTRAPNQPIQIGDRLTLQVDVSPNLIPPGQSVVLRPHESKTSPEEQGWFIDPRPSNQLGIIRFIASPLKGGRLTLPELSIVIENGSTVAKTEPLALEVQELQRQPDEKPDLIDVLSISMPARLWFLVIFILLGLAWGGYALYRRHLKNKNATPPPAPPALPPEPDHVLAKKRIEALFQAHDYRLESLKPLSFGISEALKDYFSRRFGVDARESTTGEMLQLLREQGLERADLSQIESLFQTLDQFKFLDIESFPEAPPERQKELRDESLRIIDRWALHPPTPGGTR